MTDTCLPMMFMGAQPTWELPELTSVNKLSPRATFWPFPSPDAARQRLPEHSPFVHSLDGDWDFQYFDRPAAVTVEALAAGDWRTLAVPGNWTMQLRHEDLGGEAFAKPHYTNIQMPFAEQFPHVPEHTATGVYRTTITVPDDWQDQRIVLHFAGCESLLYVYLDGQFVGLQQRQPHPGRVRHYRAGRAGCDGGTALCQSALLRRELPGRSGSLVAGGHPPRTCSCVATPRTFIADLRRPLRPRRRLPIGDARHRRYGWRRRYRAAERHRARRTAGRRRQRRVGIAAAKRHSVRTPTRGSPTPTTGRTSRFPARSSTPACGAPKRPTSTPSS